jgi:cytochrome c peroxidase
MAKHQIGVHLTKEQIDEIVEFLKTLEGDLVDYDIKG